MSQCPQCGCQVESPFDGKTVIHDASRCGAISAAPLLGDRVSVEYNIDTRVFESGIIEMKLRSEAETLAKWVMDTQNEAIRKSLIALGWTPPSKQ